MDEKSQTKDYDKRLLEWEMGLPSPEELIPLSQSLITPELASAFDITAEASRSALDLNRASHDTYSTIFRREESFEPLKLFPDKNELDGFGNINKIRKIDGGVGIGDGDEANSGLKEEGFNVGVSGGGEENGSNRAVKRPRLVWTPQLHKRFVDVIEHLGIDKAVPKTIMEMMNVEGLTRENVASHLQKYRLYLKRVEGLSSDHQGSSTPPRRAANNNVCDSSKGYGQMQPSTVPLMPIPMVGAAAAAASSYGYGHLGMHVGGAPPIGYCGLESGACSMFWNRQRG
ncbi:hypothetical protein Ancab_034373 [Ancistrocladus abbreviatus]